MCKCYGRLQKAIREQHDDPNAELNYALTMKGNLYPTVGYTYRRKKKNGEFENKERTGTIVPTFCPFCGKKYPKKK